MRKFNDECMIARRSILSNYLTDNFPTFYLPKNKKSKKDNRAKDIISDDDHLINFYIFCSL